MALGSTSKVKSTTESDVPVKNTQQSFAKEKILIIGILLSVLMSSGLSFGFSSLKLVLLDLDVYANKCDSQSASSLLMSFRSYTTDIFANLRSPSIGLHAIANSQSPPAALTTYLTSRSSDSDTQPWCNAQVQQLDLIYTLNSALSSFLVIPSGLVLDYFGQKLTFLSAHTLLAIGLVMMTLSLHYHPTLDLYMPGFIFIGFSGLTILSASFQVGSLVPEPYSHYVSIALNVSFDVSALIFSLFEIFYFTHTSSIDRRSLAINFFAFYVIIPLTSFIFGLCCMSNKSHPLAHISLHETKIPVNTDHSNLESDTVIETHAILRDHSTLYSTIQRPSISPINERTMDSSPFLLDDQHDPLAPAPPTTRTILNDTDSNNNDLAINTHNEKLTLSRGRKSSIKPVTEMHAVFGLDSTDSSKFKNSDDSSITKSISSEQSVQRIEKDNHSNYKISPHRPIALQKLRGDTPPSTITQPPIQSVAPVRPYTARSALAPMGSAFSTRPGSRGPHSRRISSAVGVSFDPHHKKEIVHRPIHSAKIISKPAIHQQITIHTTNAFRQNTFVPERYIASSIMDLRTQELSRSRADDPRRAGKTVKQSVDDLRHLANTSKQYESSLESFNEASNTNAYPDLRDASFRTQWRSLYYTLFVFYISCVVLALNLYLSTVTNQLHLLDAQLNNTRTLTVSNVMISIWGIILPAGGLCTAPLLGWLLISSKPYILFLLPSALMVLSLTTATIPNLQVQYFTFCVVAVSRPITWTLASEYISQVFGFASFGRLYGILLLIVGVLNFLIYGLNLLALELTTYTYVNIAVLVCQFPALVFPFFLRRWFIEQRSEEGSADSFTMQ